VDRARTEKGWTLHQLSLQAQVSRPIVSRLINHAAVPGRKSTRDAIGTALGWEPGSCDAILAGGEPVDGAHAFLVTKAAAQRLGARIDQARQDVGLNKNDLARIASVSRPVVSRLINHAEVPGRKAVRDAIGTARGWSSADATPSWPVGSPHCAARRCRRRWWHTAWRRSRTRPRRRRSSPRARPSGGARSATARAAALLALRGGAALASHGQNGVSNPL
jgi:transcriptional regulator with XRE-family HTH domain